MRSIGAISGNFAPPLAAEERGKYYFINDAQRPLAQERGGGGPGAPEDGALLLPSDHLGGWTSPGDHLLPSGGHNKERTAQREEERFYCYGRLINRS